MKIPEEFKEADVLAEFANLDTADAEALPYFRNNYPDFAPAEWWNYQTYLLDTVPIDPDDPDFKGTDFKGSLTESIESIWQVTQEEIQRVWQQQFKFETVFNLTELLKGVFVAPPELVETGDYLDLPDGAFDELIRSKVYAFHNAVLYLYHQPWRAKICKGCGKYFVANHPKREFCEYPDARGETCRFKNDNRRHLEYYHEAGKNKRQRKSQGVKKAAKKKKAAR